MSVNNKVQNEMPRANLNEEFAKLFTDNVDKFTGLNNIDMKVLICMCNQMYKDKEDDQLYINSTKYVREHLSKVLGVGDGTVKKYFQRLKEAGILIETGFKGIYFVNPYFMAMSKGKYVLMQREKFEYIDGVWLRKEEYKIS